MIRMICIHEGDWRDENGSFLKMDGPSYLEECFLNMSKEYDGIIYYKIQNYTHDKYLRPQFYNSKWFIPCSDIDETELVNEKECITQL